MLIGLTLGVVTCISPLRTLAQPQGPTLAHSRPAAPTPEPRPPALEVEAKMRQLFEAIVQDKPELAAACFFPREAFLLVKDMRDPGRYYDRLRRRFDADIRALHLRLPELARAQFERFELAQRGGLVAPGQGGNRLPYWASRHSLLYFRVATAPGALPTQRQQLEVRVLITWQGHWYVIHLNEFR